MAIEDPYRRLQQHLDNMPVGFPATESGVELRVLKHLFSPEEAELACHLSALPEPLEKIHRRAKKTGLGLAETRVSLKRMARKGAILRTRVKGKPHYSKAMLAIGMFEFQANRLTKDFYTDVKEYMEGEFGKAFHTTKTSQMRTIPINEDVLPERQIGTYDRARDLVGASKGPFAVLNCICRQGMDLQGQPCRQTEIRETCLLMGTSARDWIRAGTGRKVSKEDMLAFLERANQVGMVLQPQNTRDPAFICCCCGCCCGVLGSAKKLPRPADYFDTNYYAGVDGDHCSECGTCSDRCAMDAISYLDDVALVDPDRCIGCGLCVSTCPEGAIQLYPREETRVPPPNQNALYFKIMAERIGPAGIAKVAVKKALGLKI